MDSLEIKPIWTDDDYASMGWHDCVIRAVAFMDDSDYSADQYDSELAFDVDYIFQWILNENQGYSFGISPCTLVFEGAYDVSLNLTTVGYTPVFSQIIDLTIEPDKELLERNFRRYDVRIELERSAMITFQSTGFKQYVRKPPILSRRQWLTLPERGGVCFDRTAIAKTIGLPSLSISSQQTEKGGNR